MFNLYHNIFIVDKIIHEGCHHIVFFCCFCCTSTLNIFCICCCCSVTFLASFSWIFNYLSLSAYSCSFFLSLLFLLLGCGISSPRPASSFGFLVSANVFPFLCPLLSFLSSISSISSISSVALYVWFLKFYSGGE